MADVTGLVTGDGNYSPSNFVEQDGWVTADTNGGSTSAPTTTA